MAQTYRRIIVIGVAPGELAGDLTRIYHAPMTRPKFKRDASTGALIRDPIDAVEAVTDEKGKPIKHPRCGARPAKEWGPDDPGDPGIPTLRYRVVYWLRAAPGQWKPIPRLDRAGNESANWLSPTRVPQEGPQAAQLFEIEALRAGEIVEVVEDESCGQLEVRLPTEERNALFVQRWDELQGALVAPRISGVAQLPPDDAAPHLISIT